MAVPIETLILPATAGDALARAAAVLRNGGLVAFPTDTVYGVGAHGFLPEAIAGLYRVKERPLDQPIPLLLGSAADLSAVCVDIPPIAWSLAERFWPGALSLVLRRAPIVPELLVAGGATVAVRVPDQPLVRALCRELNAPLAATSANRHAQPPPTTAGAVSEALGGRISLILDGGPSPGGVPSTVLDLTVSPPVILRPGPISASALSQRERADPHASLPTCGRH